MSSVPPVQARRLWEALEPVHAVAYFEPEPLGALADLGLKGFWMGYFAGRAAAMGPVAPAVVEATFANFHPSMIRRAIPDAWSLATPEAVVEARTAGAGRALERIWGGPPSAEAVDLVGHRLLAAFGSADPVGRPLFTAHAALPAPTDPAALVWHAATVLREHRGDGHVAALTAEGISGLDAHVLAVGRGVTDRATQQGARKWTDEEWDRAVEALAARGLVHLDGTLTDHGHDLVVRIEAVTDRRSAQALEPAADVLPDVLAAAEPLARSVLANGTLPFPNPIGYTRPSWAEDGGLPIT